MTLFGFSQDNRYMSVSTALGDGALELTGLSGEEGISSPFLYRLEMLSSSPSLDFASIVGQPATVSVTRGDGGTRYINGIVTRFVQAGMDSRFYRYRAELRPWFWLLTLARDCRIFQNQTIPDVVTSLFSALGFTAFQNSCSKTYQPRDFCVQYNESAFDFVSRRLEEEGIFYYFQHANGSHTLVLADDSGSQPACPGLASVKYKAGGDAAWIESELVLDCSIHQQMTTNIYTVDDFNFETPTMALTSASGSGALSSYEFPAGFSVKSDGETRATNWLEAAESYGSLIKGSSTARSFVAGYTVSLTDHYRNDTNIAYLLTRIVTHADHDSWSNSFEAVPASVVFRPPRVTRRPIIAGTQTAIVTGPQNAEIWTDQYGRIKVQFHWDRIGTMNDQSSCWIRVSQGWAGKSWGAFFLPRIGMEVIVTFLEGDPDNPLVTGAVYNGDQTVPYALPDNQTRSTIKSNSSVGGQGYNEFRFEDKKGSEEIYLQAQKDMNVLVNNDWTETITQNRTATISKGNESLTVSQGNRSVTVSQGDDSLTVSQGNHTVSVATGNETYGVKGTRDLTVTGAETHTNSDKFTHKVSGDYSLTIGGNLTISVSGNISLKSSGGSVDIEASTSYLAKSGTTLTNNAGTDLTNQAGVGLTNKGVNVTNNASAQLTNQAGAAQTVDGGGMLTLKGGLVKIN